MKKALLILVSLLLAAQASLASHTSMIGGLRDGLALGLLVEEHLNHDLMYRYSVEASTGEDTSFQGDNPFVLSGGGRLRLGKFGTSPVWGALGVTGNFGNNTEIGLTLSLIFEKINDQDPLFLEAGLDWFNDPSHAHAQVQIGYRFIDVVPL